MIDKIQWWQYLSHAGPVVKLVMLLLLLASVVSWTIIFQRSMFLLKMKDMIAQFEKQFWSGQPMDKLFNQLEVNAQERLGLNRIFHAGFQEYLRVNQTCLSAEQILEMVTRAMRINSYRELDRMQRHISILATIGSTSPYVGLFGTVWGIMTSFQALGHVQQATIAMVAPGISEALIATAMGLFAAIPAVIAYNRFSQQVENIEGRFETFQEEFINVLTPQLVAEG